MVNGAELFANAKCVIFDFDGVVADSETFSLGTLRDALADFGLAMPLEEVRARFLGKSLKTIEAHVVAQKGCGAADGFAEAWQATLFATFRAELRAMPGVVSVLDALDRVQTPYCIASSSSFERLGVALSAMRLTERFTHVFSAEQVDRGKPAPDLFLLAATHLNVEPADCLVIEDSPHGIQAATAAGMRSIGFVGGDHLRDIEPEHETLLLAAGAALVIPGYAGLPDAMEGA